MAATPFLRFFDLPWIFIYLWVIYLVHPLLGLTATGGAVVIFVIGLLQSGLTQKDTAKAVLLKNEAQQWVAAGFRTGRELQSMGMIGNAADRYCHINDQEIQLHDKTGNVRHILGAISQSFGILMQVIIYGVGALLVVGQRE